MVLNIRHYLCGDPNNIYTHIHTCSRTLVTTDSLIFEMLSNRFRFKLVLTATVQHMNFKLTAICVASFVDVDGVFFFLFILLLSLFCFALSIFVPFSLTHQANVMFYGHVTLSLIIFRPKCMCYAVQCSEP